MPKGLQREYHYCLFKSSGSFNFNYLLLWSFHFLCLVLFMHFAVFLLLLFLDLSKVFVYLFTNVTFLFLSLHVGVQFILHMYLFQIGSDLTTGYVVSFFFSCFFFLKYIFVLNFELCGMI